MGEKGATDVQNLSCTIAAALEIGARTLGIEPGRVLQRCKTLARPSLEGRSKLGGGISEQNKKRK